MAGKLKYQDKSRISEQIRNQLKRVTGNLKGVKRKVAVMSGKGGVGKSTVTVTMGLVLASQGKRVAILDADLNGPCISRMLDAVDGRLEVKSDGISPWICPMGIKLASIDMLLEGEDRPLRWKGPMESNAVWRGSMEMTALREILAGVQWGELDYLLIDLPPGTNDNTLAISQLIHDLDGAVVVTTPAGTARSVVKKSVLLAREYGIPLLGLVENMSNFTCPECGKSSPLFGANEAVQTGEFDEEMELPILGRVPFNRALFLEEKVRVFDKDEPEWNSFLEIIRHMEEVLNYSQKPALF